MINKKLLVALSCMGALTVNAQEAPSWDALNNAAKNHLINLVAIDTSSANPDEISAARYIYKQFNTRHIDWDIFIPRKGRANLMARIKGTDPAKKPLLLISHLDTANVQDGWTFTPFKATLKDGNIYGLGTTDAKNYTAAYLALFTWLAEQKQKPVRDIIFLATSGEETGSEPGLVWLGNTHWEQIKPGFALSEGGGIIKDNDGPDIVFAEAASKLYMDIKITALGKEGHTSIPQENNAVYNLSQALAKIENLNLPARVTAPAKTLLTAIFPLQDEDGKTTIKMLLSDDNPQNRQTAAQLITRDPFFKTQLQDTITPTQVSSPAETGATSATASAVLNVRLLPDTDPDEFLARLQALFKGDDNILLEVLERPQTPAPKPMDGTDPLFAAIKNTAAQLLPGAITVPGLSPASGDNEILRKLGVITYGLGPQMDPLAGNTPHSANEHIREQDFYNQLQFLAGVVFDFAYGQDLLPLIDDSSTEKK